MQLSPSKAALQPTFERVRKQAGALALSVVMASSFMFPALADDAAAEAAYRDIEATLGGVPSFVRAYPKAALPGAWAQVKAMEFSGPTALDSKVKALISLAVGAQIPCHYCVWLDTRTARSYGATDEEIAEAVTMAAIARHWSTVFHGQQLDFDQFRREFGSD